MSAVMLTVPDAQAAMRNSRIRLAASWLFVLPLLTEGVAPAVVKVQVGGLAVLAFASVVILQHPIPHGTGKRVYLLLTTLSLTVIGYMAFGQWPSWAGSASSYNLRAVMFVLTYTTVGVFAVLFFDEDIFERVLWRAAVIALWIGVATCLASRLTGHLLLVNPNNGGLRMVGSLSEPSDWASVLTLVMLLALRRRSWLYVALALAGLALADSPTCILVMAVTVPLYFVLASKWKHRIVALAALGALIPGAVIFVQDANADAWIASRNSAEVAVGRLVNGIRNAETGGQVGYNSRVTTTTIVVADTRNGGWMRTGAGPAADATYFTAEYPKAAGPPMAANALWVSTLFDLGEWGVAVLGVMMLAAVWRMHRNPRMTAILLPFLTASLVNSSIPDYSFAALGIMLFAFGWMTRAPSRLTAAGRAWNSLHRGVTVMGTGSAPR
jgi:hypothetical protein